MATRMMAASLAGIACATLAFGALAFSGWAMGVEARADELPPRILPRPYVRARRPVVVKVPHAARVRADAGPWALPQGAHGDEFVLQVPRADLGLGEIEIVGLDGAIRRERVAARVLARDGRVRATLGGAAAPDTIELLLSGGAPDETLPTIREGWLVFDSLVAADGTETGVIALGLPERAAIDAWRAGPSGPARAAFDPLLHEAGDAVFRATAEAAATAPRLSVDVALALGLCAAVTAVLALLVRRDAASGRRRTAWIAAPSAGIIAWFALAAPLPGPVQVTALSIDGAEDRLVVLRFETDVAADVAFAVPTDGTSAAILAWDDADRTVRDAETGRRVRISLPARAVRIVAWREPPPHGPRVEAAQTTMPHAPGAPGRATLPGPEVARWLRGLGLEPTGFGVAAGVRLPLPRGFRVIDSASWSVAARK